MARMLTETMKKGIASKYPLGSQDGKKGNAICVVKFFFGNFTWYVTEASYEKDDFIMFGVVVTNRGAEFSYISYNELQSLTWYGCQCVERDRYFKRCKLSEIKDDALQSFLKLID